MGRNLAPSVCVCTDLDMCIKIAWRITSNFRTGKTFFMSSWLPQSHFCLFPPAVVSQSRFYCSSFPSRHFLSWVFFPWRQRSVALAVVKERRSSKTSVAQPQKCSLAPRKQRDKKSESRRMQSTNLCNDFSISWKLSFSRPLPLQEQHGKFFYAEERQMIRASSATTRKRLTMLSEGGKKLFVWQMRGAKRERGN